MTKIIGDKELQRKLRSLGDLRFLRPTMLAIGVEIKGQAKIYPPSTSANVPNPVKPWYERGYGVKWMRQDGSIGGAATSEQLDKRWTSRTKPSGTGVIIGNNASYARLVQGPEQLPQFARIGWKTTDQIMDENEAKALRQIQKRVDRELAK